MRTTNEKRGWENFSNHCSTTIIMNDLVMSSSDSLASCSYTLVPHKVSNCQPYANSSSPPPKMLTRDEQSSVVGTNQTLDADNVSYLSLEDSHFALRKSKLIPLPPNGHRRFSHIH